MMARLILMSFLFTSSFVAENAVASESSIKWHPSSPIYLGATLDPLDLTTPKVPCPLFDRSTDIVPIDTGAPKTEFQSKIVTEKSELMNLFSVSASLSASYLLLSGGGSLSKIQELDFTSKSINWVLSARSDFGRFALRKIALDDQYANLPEPTLRALCGTHVAVIERREAAVAAVFTFRSSSRRVRDELSAALSAKWMGGKFSSDVASKLNETVSKTQVEFTFMAKGGDGLSATSGFVTAFDQLDKIREGVSKYISGVTVKKAPAAEYSFARLPDFHQTQGIPSKRERVLSELFYDYLQLDQNLKEARQINQNRGRYWYVPSDMLKDAMDDIIVQTSKKIDQLVEVAESCKDDVDACVYEPRVFENEWPWPSLDVIGVAGGYACSPFPNCDGEYGFTVLLNGPVQENQFSVSDIVVTLPGGSGGYNCHHYTPVIVPGGVKYRCLLHPVRGEKEEVRIVVSSGKTNAIAFDERLADVYPEIPWP